MPIENKEKKTVHSEIMYMKKDGINIHSDTCPPGCDFKNLDDEHRKYLHDVLDEWIDKSNGTGIFYIKEEGFVDKDDER